MAEEPSLSYYLPIAGGRIIGFIPFPRVLVLCEMQSVSSRIWTRIAVFISYGDNDYTTGTSMVQSQLYLSTAVSQQTLFQNPQILRAMSSEHDVIHTPALFPAWGFIMAMVIVISFAHERNCTKWLCTRTLRDSNCVVYNT